MRMVFSCWDVYSLQQVYFTLLRLQQMDSHLSLFLSWICTLSVRSLGYCTVVQAYATFTHKAERSRQSPSCRVLGLCIYSLAATLHFKSALRVLNLQRPSAYKTCDSLNHKRALGLLISRDHKLHSSIFAGHCTFELA